MELKGNPRCVTYLNDDEILIVDTNNDRIQQINIQTGTVVKTLGKEGLGIGDFDIPGNSCSVIVRVCVVLKRTFVGD